MYHNSKLYIISRCIEVYESHLGQAKLVWLQSNSKPHRRWELYSNSWIDLGTIGPVEMTDSKDPFNCISRNRWPVQFPVIVPFPGGHISCSTFFYIVTIWDFKKWHQVPMFSRTYFIFSVVMTVPIKISIDFQELKQVYFCERTGWKKKDLSLHIEICLNVRESYVVYICVKYTKTISHNMRKCHHLQLFWLILLQNS